MYQSFIEQASMNKFNYHIHENLENFGRFSFKSFTYDYNKIDIKSLNGANLLEYKEYISKGAIIIERKTPSLEGMQRINKWNMEYFVSAVSCYRDNHNKQDLVVFGFNNGAIGIMNLLHTDPNKELFIVKDSHRGRVTSIHVTGTTIYTTSSDHTIRKWVIVLKNSKYEIEPRAMFRGHQDEVNKVVSVPGKSTIISCSNDNCVIIWEQKPGQIIVKPTQSILMDANVMSVLLCKDNEHFITATTDNKLTLWSLSDYKMKDTLDDICCCAPGCLNYREDDVVVYGNNKLVSVSVEDEGLVKVDEKEFSGDVHKGLGITKEMIAIFQSEDNEVVMATMKKKVFKINAKNGNVQVKTFADERNNIEGMYKMFNNKCAVVFGKRVEILSN